MNDTSPCPAYPLSIPDSASASPLRVLVVLPFYGGSLPVGQHCVHALRELGHTVDVFEAPDFFSAFTSLKHLRITADRLEELENSFLQVISQAIYAKTQTFEPDLVLALAQAPLNRQVLRRLRKDGVATAMWFVEDFRLFTYWRAFAPYYDFFFVIQKEPLLAELAAIGVDNALYLPLAALPSLHRPLELAPGEKHKYGSDVSFLGAGYPNRRTAFRHLTNFQFKIWGSDWEGETVLAPHIQAQGMRISSEDSVKIFNASHINVNLHSSVRAQPPVVPGDFVNPRTFEVAACGAFQLVDRRELMPELFQDNELATFSTLDELQERITCYLARPEERQAIAARGRARVLAEHTYAHRMASLVRCVAQRRPGWPAARHSTLPDALPEALRNELGTLFSGLGLPDTAAFEEVVARLRQESGVLSELDVSILFLDEWQKQYKR